MSISTCVLNTFNSWVMVERILCRWSFTINVWTCIDDVCLVDPHVWPHRLTGNHYRDFHLHDLLKPLEVVPLAVRARMWYVHDGAPCCAKCSHDRWTGKGGPTAWPPRSTLDLNRLDSYPWGHLNTLVYAAAVDNEETLPHRTVDAFQTIRNSPGIFARMWRSMVRRVETCTESHGGSFEHFFNYKSQIKYFQSHVDMDIVSCFGM
jgi:hypothetical protein